MRSASHDMTHDEVFFGHLRSDLVPAWGRLLEEMQVGALPGPHG
jgi:hypothetical protein